MEFDFNTHFVITQVAGMRRQFFGSFEASSMF